MVFLPNDDEGEKISMGITTEALEAEGFEVVGWRDVPVNSGIVGRFAAANEPRIKQVRHTHIQQLLGARYLSDRT